MPKANVLGEVGKGYKTAIETLNEGRIGIGAQMIGLARGALDHAISVHEGAEAVRQGDRRVPGRAVPDRARRGGRRGGAAHGLQRRAAARRRPAVPHRSGDLQDLLVGSRRARRVARRQPVRRQRLRQGYPVEKLFRDAKIGQIYEGTSNLQLQTIAKQILG